MNLEFNKIFAALLVAGITAGSASFVARKVIHPHDLEQDAVPIEGVEVAAGAVDSGPKGPEPVLHLIAMADVARGEKLSKACAACHSFDKGGPNRVGPNLWNTMGASKAHIPSFAYSDAMANFPGEWGYAEMNKFMYKPKDYIPGTKMNYIGLKKPEDRAAMIAWLRTLADSPIPLPTEAQIAAEKAELTPETTEPSEQPGVIEPEDMKPTITEDPQVPVEGGEEQPIS